MIRLAVALLCVGLAFRYLRQCRRPHGVLGCWVLRAMNISHDGLTVWGLSTAAIQPHFTVLDIGCGGGRTVSKLAAAAADGHVVGVDYSADCVAVARDLNATLIQAGRVDIKNASVAALPFGDAIFDLATAIETHYYWPHLVDNLREVARVLKPGGQLVIVAEAYAVGWYGPIYRVVMAPMGGKILSAGEHQGALAAAGFVDIEVRENRKRGWLAISGRRPSALAS